MATVHLDLVVTLVSIETESLVYYTTYIPELSENVFMQNRYIIEPIVDSVVLIVILLF